MKKIIAVVGMCGSGKSEITKFFTDKGWSSIYFGGVTMEELKKRGMPVNEKNEKSVREELRKNFGPAAFAILLKDRILAEAEVNDTILDGLYSWQEYVYLKEALGDGLTILAVVTNRQIRYDRLTGREIRPLTNESANARDIAEIENLYKGGPIAIADYYILNNGNMDELNKALEGFLADICSNQ